VLCTCGMLPLLPRGGGGGGGGGGQATQAGGALEVALLGASVARLLHEYARAVAGRPSALDARTAASVHFLLGHNQDLDEPQPEAGMRGDNETTLAPDAARSNSRAAGLATAAATATAATVTTAAAIAAVGAPTVVGGMVGGAIGAPVWLRHTNNGRAFYRRMGDDASCTLTAPGGGVSVTEKTEVKLHALCKAEAWFEERWVRLTDATATKRR